MGLMQRRKGVRGELEAAELLRSVFPEARRRVTGEEAQLVDRGRDIAGTPGFAFQVGVGRGDKPRIHAKIAEATAVAGPDDIGVAMLKVDREAWSFHMSAEEFFALVRRLQLAESRAVRADCVVLE